MSTWLDWEMSKKWIKPTPECVYEGISRDEWHIWQQMKKDQLWLWLALFNRLGNQVTQKQKKRKVGFTWLPGHHEDKQPHRPPTGWNKGTSLLQTSKTVRWNKSFSLFKLRFSQIFSHKNEKLINTLLIISSWMPMQTLLLYFGTEHSLTLSPFWSDLGITITPNPRKKAFKL